MSANENRLPSNELSDDQLDQVSGGMVDEVYLDEKNLPRGWWVTCFDCGRKFSVGEGKCPSCGSWHVLMVP